MTTIEVRKKIVAIMQSWVGRTKGSAGHKEIIDLYNSIKPLPRGYKVSYTDAWCAATVSAASFKAGYLDIMPAECSCAGLINNYKSIGRWVEDDAYIPSPGDLVIYDWDDTGIGDNTGNPDHVGMVEEVKNGVITVIEGNYSNSVKRRQIAVNGRYIRGFCCPDFASKAIQITDEEDEMKNTEENYQVFKEFMDRYLEERKSLPVASYAEESCRKAIDSGLFTDGDGNGLLDNPQAFLLRQEFATVLDRMGKLG